MKRILFAITSPGGVSDIREWERLNNDQLFDNYNCSIGNDLLCVINGSKYCDINENWEYDKIKSLISEFATNEPLGILFHERDQIKSNTLRNQLDGLNIIAIESFSTVGDGQTIYDNYITPFTRAQDIEEKINKYNLLFNRIEKKSPEDRAKKAMELRTQLLTPLVALDWLSQMPGSELIPEYKNIKDTACIALKNVLEDNSFKSSWNESDKFLPKIPQFITGVNEKDCHITHEELKGYADQIESSIEQIRNSANSI